MTPDGWRLTKVRLATLCTTNRPSCPGRVELAWDSRTVTYFTTGAALVPEPATLALLGAGLLGWGVVRRCRHAG